MENHFIIGIDFGTDSVRSLIIDASTGTQVGESTFDYPRWKEGKYCNEVINQFRQHPLDYLEGMEASISNAIKNSGGSTVAKNIRSIGVATTVSTPVAVDRDGTPLSLLSGFSENPHALFILWKDRTAVKEATEINALLKDERFEYVTACSECTYSAEWFWAKILYSIRADKMIAKHAHSWVEHCDWIPALLTGNQNPQRMHRSRYAAGHKALWHEQFNGLPSEEFLYVLDPQLAKLRSNLYYKTNLAEESVGTLCPEWANRLNLPETVVVAGGSVDAHLAAVGAGIRPYDMVKVMGTSSCNMIALPNRRMHNKRIEGIYGQVDGSIINGCTGFEVSQPAFGDVYTWFKNMILQSPFALIDATTSLNTSQKAIIKQELADTTLSHLNSEAAKLEPSQTMVAIDWTNGHKSLFADQSLWGAITGLKLSSNVYQIYRAIIEATAFGSRAILELFRKNAVHIRRVIAVGSIARQESFIMQILADVLNVPVYISASDQCSALGAAISAAVAADMYSSTEKAQKHLAAGFDKEFHPREEYTQVYNTMYKQYASLGAFIELRTRLTQHYNTADHQATV